MPSLPLYFPEKFSLPQALLCAQLVDSAYQQFEQWTAQGKPHEPNHFHWQAPAMAGWLFSAPVWSVLSALHFINEVEPFGFAARDPQGAVYLAFRGTCTAQDWLYDLELHQQHYPWQPDAGLVHGGFLRLYTSLRDQALLAVDDMHPAQSLWVCGHSLGSSLSSLAAVDMRVRWPSLPLQHYNFASPRLASPTFARHYNSLNVPTFRVVNDSDLVPTTPPGVVHTWLYQHLGQAVTFTASYASLAGVHSLADCYLYALNHPHAPMNV